MGVKLRTKRTRRKITQVPLNTHSHPSFLHLSHSSPCTWGFTGLKTHRCLSELMGNGGGCGASTVTSEGTVMRSRGTVRGRGGPLVECLPLLAHLLSWLRLWPGGRGQRRPPWVHWAAQTTLPHLSRALLPSSFVSVGRSLPSGPALSLLLMRELGFHLQGPFSL